MRVTISPRAVSLAVLFLAGTAIGQVSTIAGGFLGDGGSATSAAINLPTRVAVDATGNLYIADTGNGRVRRVDSASGIITTVAGGGPAFGTVNGSVATDILLFGVASVGVDPPSGDFLFADFSTVYRVDAVTDVISTVAGTGGYGYNGDDIPASTAMLANPSGFAVDVEGNIYIADSGNSRVRRVDGATGTITTVAGTGELAFSGDDGPATAAELNRPRAVAVDLDGNLYICDTSNYRVRRVDATTGVITTVAGNGDAFYDSNADGGPAIATGMNSPSDIAIDAAGNIFVVDSGIIRRIDGADGTISRYAGVFGGSTEDGVQAVDAALTPIGLAVDDVGDVYIATRDGQVRRVDSVSGIITTVAGGAIGDGGPGQQANLNSPGDVVVDADGHIYIADGQGYRVRRVDGATGLISTLAGTGIQRNANDDGGPASTAFLNYPYSLANHESSLFILDGLRVRVVDLTTGIIDAYAGTGAWGFSGDGGAAIDASFANANSIATDDAGNLYIADGGNARIRRVDAATGTITTIAGNGTNGFSGDDGPALDAELGYMSNLAADGDGHVYVVDGNSRVRRIDAVTAIITTVAGNGTFQVAPDGGLATETGMNPRAVATDADGTVYVLDSIRIRRIDPVTGILTTVAGNSMSGLGFAGDGGTALEAQFNNPNAITFDDQGVLFVADTGNHRVRRIVPVLPEPEPESEPVDPGSQVVTDFNADGSTGFADFIQLAGAHGSVEGGDGYAANVDLDADGDVDGEDFLLFSENFGTVGPGDIPTVVAGANVHASLTMEVVDDQLVFSTVGMTDVSGVVIRLFADSRVQIGEPTWATSWTALRSDVGDVVELSASALNPESISGDVLLLTVPFTGDAATVGPIETVLRGAGRGERNLVPIDRIVSAPPPEPDPVAVVALDVNRLFGDQGVRASARIAAQDIIAVDVAVPSGAAGLRAFEVTVAFDATALEVESWDAVDLGAEAAIDITSTSSGVTIAGTLGGPASVDAGSLGRLRFVVLDGVTDETDVRLESARFDGEPVEMIEGQGVILFSGGSHAAVVGSAAPPPMLDLPEGTITIDFDLGNLDQTMRQAGNAVEGKQYDVQLNILQAPVISGWSATIEYDPRELSFVEGSFVASDFLPGLETLVAISPGRVELGGSILGQGGGIGDEQTLGQFSVVVQGGFTGVAELHVTRNVFNVVGEAVIDQEVLHVAAITDNPVTVEIPGDFDGNGLVEFVDFFAFADAFNGSEARFDLNGDGIVSFPDLFLFADDFGRDVQLKIVAAAQQLLGLPTLDHIADAYPNPFNASTTVGFGLAVPGSVQLEVFDVLGQRVRTLASGEFGAGLHSVSWDARDDAGFEVSTGIYLVRLQTPLRMQTTKVLLTR